MGKNREEIAIGLRPVDQTNKLIALLEDERAALDTQNNGQSRWLNEFFKCCYSHNKIWVEMILGEFYVYMIWMMYNYTRSEY